MPALQVIDLNNLFFDDDGDDMFDDGMRDVVVNGGPGQANPFMQQKNLEQSIPQSTLLIVN